MIGRDTNAWLAAAFALLMVTTPMAAATGTGSTTTTQAFGVDLGAPDAPEDVVSYETTTGEVHPGVMVSVESSEDLDTLEKWANSSDQRKVVERFNSTNAALIALPREHIKPAATSVSAWLPVGQRTLTDLGYVTGWSWDRQVGPVDPIRNLDSEDSHEKPPGAWYAEATTDAEYSANAMAWDEDAPDIDMNRTRELVGADGLSSDINGSGVDVAVIDSGTNTGNGTLYGNRNPGSEMRVVDAHDYVDGESVNLSVSRSELPNELAKVEDPNGHGSWVSSSILNARSGVAPDANLMIYRTLNKDGEGSTSDIRAAIARADRNGADIIVMSLGSPVYSEAMADELKHALSEDGNVTAAFVAVGNSHPLRVSSPGDVDAVIGVTATNGVAASDAKKAYFAQVGPDTGLDGSGGATHGRVPDTAAPGMSISTPTWTDTYADGGRVTDTRLSGTSMAAPIAAGVGALLLEAEPSLEGQPDEFKTRIINSGAHTEHLGLTESRGGMVNASRAINQDYETEAPERSLTAEARGRDAGNTALAGDVGVKMSGLSRFKDEVAG